MYWDDKVLLNYIDLIYDCVLDESRWQTVLTQLSESIDAVSANIGCTEHGALVSYSYGWDQRAFDLYEGGYRDRNLWLNALLDAESDIFYNYDQLVDGSEYLDSAFYRHFASQYNLRHGIGAKFRTMDGSHVVVSFQRTGLNGPFSIDDIAFLNHLAPYFRRALSLSEHLRGKNLVGASLNQLNSAVFVLGKQGEIFWHNQQAKDLLLSNSLVLVRDNILSFRSSPSQKSFFNYIQASCSDSPFAWREMDKWDSRTGYEIKISSFIGERAVPSVRGHDAGFVVCIKSAGDVFLGITELMRTLYDFTPREASTVWSLCNGDTRENICKVRHVSRHTISNQIKSAMKKIGVSSQYQLVGVVLRGVAGL